MRREKYQLVNTHIKYILIYDLTTGDTDTILYAVQVKDTNNKILCLNIKTSLVLYDIIIPILTFIIHIF